MTDRDERETFQDSSPSFPTGADVAGPGTVRQGSGYSGTTSGGAEGGAGPNPSPDDAPSASYSGGTTSSDAPHEDAVTIDVREDE